MYNNFHTDHIAFAEMPLAVHIQNAISLHISDNKVHITEDERKAWNDKLGQDDLAQILAQLDQKEDKKDGEDIPASEQYVTEQDLKNAITTALSDYITEDRVNCKILAVRNEIPKNITDLNGGTNLATKTDLNNLINTAVNLVRTSDILFTLNGSPVVFGGSVHVEGGGGSQYVLPVAQPGTLGGIKTGYSSADGKYAVSIDSEINGNAYVDLSDIAITLEDAVTDISTLQRQVSNLPQTNDLILLAGPVDLYASVGTANALSYIFAETNLSEGDDSRVTLYHYDPGIPDGDNSGMYVGGMTITNYGISSGSYVSNQRMQPESNLSIKKTQCPTPITFEFQEGCHQVTTPEELLQAAEYFENNPFERHVSLTRMYDGIQVPFYVFRDDIEHGSTDPTLLNPEHFDEVYYRDSYYPGGLSAQGQSAGLPAVYNAYNDEMYAQSYNVRISDRQYYGYDNVQFFDQSNTYLEGDFVKYYPENTIYKFVSAHTGPWTGLDVEIVKKADSLKGLSTYILCDGYGGNTYYNLKFVGGILVGVSLKQYV